MVVERYASGWIFQGSVSRHLFPTTAAHHDCLVLRPLQLLLVVIVMVHHRRSSSSSSFRAAAISTIVLLPTLVVVFCRTSFVVGALSMPTSPTAPPPQSASSIRILAFGDSLTAGTSPPNYELYPYAPYLEAALNQRGKLVERTVVVVVRHVGFPGWTAVQMVDDANGPRGLQTTIRRIQDPSLSLVILLAGTNDLGMGRNPKDIFQSILQLHHLCSKDVDDAIQVPHTLAIGIPPSGYQSMVPEAAAMAQQINQQLNEYATTTTTTSTTTTKSSSTFTYTPFPFDYEPGGENWSKDGLHFSQRGYQVLGESLAPIVEQILLFLGKDDQTLR
jgi:lysophospholipase L1-like esterase